MVSLKSTTSRSTATTTVASSNNNSHNYYFQHLIVIIRRERKRRGQSVVVNIVVKEEARSSREIGIESRRSLTKESKPIGTVPIESERLTRQRRLSIADPWVGSIRRRTRASSEEEDTACVATQEKKRSRLSNTEYRVDVGRPRRSVCREKKDPCAGLKVNKKEEPVSRKGP